MIGQFLHRFRYGEMLCVQGLAFDAFAEQEHINRIALPKRELPKRKAFHTVSGSFELMTMPNFIIVSYRGNIGQRTAISRLD